MSYKCMMCQQPITKNEGEWGMEFSLTKWMHYKCIEHLWDAYSSMRKPTQDTRVRCTADGEYPEHNDEVVFQSEISIKSYVGRHIINKYGHAFVDNSGYAYWAENDPIYWKPLTGLKEQYERERE